MRKRNYRSLLAALLAAVIMFGTAADVFAGNDTQATAAVQEADGLNLETGLFSEELVEMDLDEFTGAQYDAKELAGSADTSGTFSSLKASQIYTDDWDQYSTNYYYNLMTDAQKEFWDALDAMCLNYLNNKTNMTSYRPYRFSKKVYYVTDYVYSSELSKDEVLLVAQIFNYSNPQYYYLYPGKLYAWSNEGVGVSFIVYGAFANGNDRALATEKFQSAIQSWTKEVSGYGTDYEKVKAIHDLICANTVYNYDIIDADGTVSINAEETAMSQSAYSTFTMGTTVCAGYAQACELLCNAVGVDSIVVTSSNHEWNKVRMEDSWYNVDCTWDDQTVPVYTFFARSDNAYDNQLSDSSSHQEESYWNDYIPKCTLDSGSTSKAAGTLPAVTEQTEPVIISAEPVYTTNSSTGLKSVKSYQVTMICATEGASIYYTTDGSTPSVASGKAKKYEKAITVKDTSEISAFRAIAVCDKKYDSEVVTGEGYTQPAYTIRYVLNGGTDSGNNPTSYTSSDAAIKLDSPTKKGYTFAGWYTSKTFDTSKVTKIAKGSGGNITLYAKWTPITYKITFKGNGATSGSMSQKSCKYGKTYNLTANKFKRKGYTFAGWNTKKNGTGKTYKNKASIKNLTSASGKTITLYAQWKKNK
jgi:uncharacterized repeat protein (TIGR02543 family)